MIRYFIDNFNYVRGLSVESKDDLETVMENIDTNFSKGLESAVTHGIDIRDYDSARFSVCAFIDEYLMQTRWKHQNQWKNCLYQRKFYSTSNSGIEFFERLEKLSIKSNSIREVYLLCLVFGFSGRYSKLSDSEKLKNLQRTELEKLHRNYVETASNRWSNCHREGQIYSAELTNPYGRGFNIFTKHKNFPFWLLGASVSIYIVYTFFLDYRLSLAMSSVWQQ